MAEILLRVVDKTNDDKQLDAQCSKRGDVIVVMPDGWAWGREELKSDVWRIVKLPGVDPDSLRDLTGPVVARVGEELVIVRKRAKRLAVDKLDVLLQQKLDESKQGDEKAVVVLSAKEATDLIAQRETKVIDEIVRIG